MAMDIGLLEDDFGAINGMHILQDVKQMQLAHIFSPAMAKKAMTIFQHAYPNRPKGMHFFNLPSFFDMIFGIVKPLLTEKMKNRVRVEGILVNFDCNYKLLLILGKYLYRWYSRII